MPKSLDQFDAQLQLLLKDGACLLSEPDRAAVIAQAVADFSRDRPATKKFDFNGDDDTFQFDMPDDWVADFSTVKSIEYPVGQRSPRLLASSDFIIYQDSSGDYSVLLSSATPMTGEVLRVEITLPRSLETVPDQDFYAVCDRAASLAFLSMSAKQTQTTDPGALADAVDRQESADRYRQLAAAALKRYDEHMGLDADESAPAASGTVSYEDSEELAAGIRPITHPRLRNR